MTTTFRSKAKRPQATAKASGAMLCSTDAGMEEGMIEVLSQSLGGGLQWRGVAALAAKARRLAALVALWRRRARERRLLATLDDRLLRDIGITRLEATRECDKPFWRA